MRYRIRLAAVLCLATAALTSLEAQTSMSYRLGGVEARLSALAGSGKAMRMGLGGIALASGIGGGAAVMITGGDFLWNSVPTYLAGSAAIIAGGVSGGLFMGLPSRAENYLRLYREMPGGLFGQDEARLAAGEAWLEDLAARGRSARLAGAILAFTASAWGFLGTGWMDGLIPIGDFSSTISPLSGLPGGGSASAVVGVSTLAMGLVLVILESNAEEAWYSYWRAQRLSAEAVERPALAMALDCLGARIRL